MSRLRQLEITGEELNIPVEVIEQKVLKAIPALTKQEEVEKILNDNGASLSSLVHRLAHINQVSDDERMVHETGKTLLGLHGVMKDKERESQTNIQIVIQTDPSKMDAILNPQRT